MFEQLLDNEYFYLFYKLYFNFSSAHTRTHTHTHTMITEDIVFIGYPGMNLVSYSYRVRDTCIAPFVHRITPFLHHIAQAKQVRYKNHAMMFYLSLNCSIAVLA